MKDKIVIITGGNAGIGFETALALFKKGAHVVLVSRSKEKGDKAVVNLKASAEGKVDLLVCDLSGLENVRALAKTINERYSHIDVLINNAGLVVGKLQLSPEGFELQFAVNHLSHFLLTALVFDKLKAAPSARIVNVASMAHYKGKLDFDNLQGENKSYQGMVAYQRSKLCNVLFTRELASKLVGTNITTNCLHPGVVRTQIGNKDNWLFSLGWTLIKPFMITPEKGAKTSIYLASSPEAAKLNGEYLNEKQVIKKPARIARETDLGKQLWEKSEEFCKQKFTV